MRFFETMLYFDPSMYDRFSVRIVTFIEPVTEKREAWVLPNDEKTNTFMGMLPWACTPPVELRCAPGTVGMVYTVWWENIVDPEKSDALLASELDKNITRAMGGPDGLTVWTERQIVFHNRDGE